MESIQNQNKNINEQFEDIEQKIIEEQNPEIETLRKELLNYLLDENKWPGK